MVNAKAIITKAIENYDDGYITRSTLLLYVEEALKHAYDAGYTRGVDEAAMDEGDLDFAVEFEEDFDDQEDAE